MKCERTISKLVFARDKRQLYFFTFSLRSRYKVCYGRLQRPRRASFYQVGKSASVYRKCAHTRNVNLARVGDIVPLVRSSGIHLDGDRSLRHSLSLSLFTRKIEISNVTYGFPDERSSRKEKKIGSARGTALYSPRGHKEILSSFPPAPAPPPRTLGFVRNARAIFVHRCARNCGVFCLSPNHLPSVEFRSMIHDPKGRSSGIRLDDELSDIGR